MNDQKNRNPAKHVKSLLVTGVSVLLVAVSNVSFAAPGDIDVAQALSYIAGGLAAAGTVTAAMFGLVALIGAAKKAMRAGT